MLINEVKRRKISITQLVDLPDEPIYKIQPRLENTISKFHSKKRRYDSIQDSSHENVIKTKRQKLSKITLENLPDEVLLNVFKYVQVNSIDRLLIDKFHPTTLVQAVEDLSTVAIVNLVDNNVVLNDDDNLML